MPDTLPAQNSSFSRRLPGLQLGVDSTSLGQFKTCPRLYYYSIVLGWEPASPNVHLTFGLLLHEALERYDHLRACGEDHERALSFTVRCTLRQTWDPKLQRPWSSGDSNKNRLTLIRTIVWYLDEFGAKDPLATVQLTSGRPAVELSFQFDSGYTSTVTGEAFQFCGHLDRLVEFTGGTYIVDSKTTKHTLSPDWFKQFTPDNQMSMYALAGQIAFGRQMAGIIINGMQILVEGTRFQRGLVLRDGPQLDEWLADTGRWLAQMEGCAAEGADSLGEAAWPQNDKACHMYGGCKFRDVCSRSPAARQPYLEANFRRRVWDPLRKRGDI